MQSQLCYRGSCFGVEAFLDLADFSQNRGHGPRLPGGPKKSRIEAAPTCPTKIPRTGCPTLRADHNTSMRERLVIERTGNIEQSLLVLHLPGNRRPQDPVSSREGRGNLTTQERAPKIVEDQARLLEEEAGIPPIRRGRGALVSEQVR